MGKSKKGEALLAERRRERVSALFAELDDHFDEKAFNQLERSDPLVAQTLTELVGEGVGENRIVSHLLHKYPHMWIQTQGIRAAVRYLVGWDDDIETKKDEN